jgi:P27 family predicted phage terminase small subunit
VAKHRDEPKTQKKTSGNSESRELTKKEPKAIPVVECPPELGPVARQEWDRIAGALTTVERLTVLDRALLAAYCNAYALWLEAVEALEKYGAVMKSPSDYPVQSPYVSIANRQVEIMIRIAAEFGFTPASRSRLPTSSKSDPWLDIPRLEDFDFKQL